MPGWLLLSATALSSAKLNRVPPPPPPTHTLVYVDEFNNEFDTVENNI